MNSDPFDRARVMKSIGRAIGPDGKTFTVLPTHDQLLDPNINLSGLTSVLHYQYGEPPKDKMPQDEYIAMKMLTRYKQLRKEDKNKPQPDIGWMLELLAVVREYEGKEQIQ